jgi:hypothetical protein
MLKHSFVTGRDAESLGARDRVLTVRRHPMKTKSSLKAGVGPKQEDPHPSR